jgi:transposase
MSFLNISLFCERMDTPATTCKIIIRKVNDGMTQRAISAQLHLSQSAVARAVIRYKKTGKFTALRPGRCGRKLSLSVRTARLLARASVYNPRASAREVQTTVGGNANNVSLSTVRRSLVRSGRLAIRPVKSPAWTPAQMLARLQWARKYSGWSVDRWKKVRNRFQEKY